MSNTQIADALVVAETTVKTHVARIVTKLDLRDRAQAVVTAYPSGLIQPASTTKGDRQQIQAARHQRASRHDRTHRRDDDGLHAALCR